MFRCSLHVARADGTMQQADCGTVQATGRTPASYRAWIDAETEPGILYAGEHFEAGAMQSYRVEYRRREIVVVERVTTEEDGEGPWRRRAGFRVQVPARGGLHGIPVPAEGDRALANGLLSYAAGDLGVRPRVLSWGVARQGEQYAAALILQASTLGLWQAEQRRRGTFEQAQRNVERAARSCANQREELAASRRRSREEFAAAERRAEATVQAARRQVQEAQQALNRARQGGAAGPPGFGGRARRGADSSRVQAAEQDLARAQESLAQTEREAQDEVDEAEWGVGSNERESERCEGWTVVSRIDPESVSAVICVQRGGGAGEPSRSCQPVDEIFAGVDESDEARGGRVPDEDYHDSEETFLLRRAPRGFFSLRGDIWRGDFDGDRDQELVFVMASSVPEIAFLGDRGGDFFSRVWEHRLLILEPGPSPGLHPLLLDSHPVEPYTGELTMEPLRRTVRFVPSQGRYVLQVVDLSLPGGPCDATVRGRWAEPARTEGEWLYATGLPSFEPDRGSNFGFMEGDELSAPPCAARTERREGEIAYDPRTREWVWPWVREAE